jgi:hypothetical protein
MVPQHQIQLLLAEVLVDERQGETVKGEVPRRVPRVLPLVGHGDHVGVVHVVPAVVAGGGTSSCLEGLGSVLLEPPVDVVVVELLGPQHPGQRLAHHAGRVGVEGSRDDRGVELVRFLPALVHQRVEATPERPFRPRARRRGRGGRYVTEPQPKRAGGAGLHRERIVRRGLRPGLRGVHRLPAPVDEVVVDPVLDVRGTVRAPEEPLDVRLVLGEQESGRVLAGEKPLPEVGMKGRDHGRAAGGCLTEDRPGHIPAPRPHVHRSHGVRYLSPGQVASPARSYSASSFSKLVISDRMIRSVKSPSPVTP